MGSNAHMAILIPLRRCSPVFRRPAEKFGRTKPLSINFDRDFAGKVSESIKNEKVEMVSLD